MEPHGQAKCSWAECSEGFALNDHIMEPLSPGADSAPAFRDRIWLYADTWDIGNCRSHRVLICPSKHPERAPRVIYISRK